MQSRAFVICLLKSIISRVAKVEISIFRLGHWFESHFVGNLEDRVSCIEAHVFMVQKLAMFVAVFKGLKSESNYISLFHERIRK